MPDGGLPDIGQGRSLRRREDRRLLTGAGRYTGDLAPARLGHAVVVRSPHAHARIAAVEGGGAAAMPGVLGVFTAADLEADGVRPMPCVDLIENRDGTPCAGPPYPVLAVDRVRFVGQPVALVVAESLAQARDAAEAVEVAYEPLPAVVEPRAALAEGAEGDSRCSERRARLSAQPSCSRCWWGWRRRSAQMVSVAPRPPMRRR